MFVCLRRLPPCAASGNTRSTLSVTPSWFTMPRGASCGATSDCVNCWAANARLRSEEHTSELQSRLHLVCRLLLEKKNTRRGLDSREGGRGSAPAGRRDLCAAARIVGD